MLLADVAFSTESMVIIGGLVAALTSTIGVLFRLLLAAKDAQLKTAESHGQSYRQMALEAVANLEMAVNERRATVGKSGFTVIAPVVPEHSSPTTQLQEDTADIQTLRARLVAASLHLELPARESAPVAAAVAPSEPERDRASKQEGPR